MPVVRLNADLGCCAKFAYFCRLWDHLMVPSLHESKQQIPYQALCKLLPDLINGSTPANATAIGILRTRLGQMDDNKAVLGLLKSIAPALR